jgi:hypothetical protein
MAMAAKLGVCLYRCALNAQPVAEIPLQIGDPLARSKTFLASPTSNEGGCTISDAAALPACALQSWCAYSAHLRCSRRTRPA